MEVKREKSLSCSSGWNTRKKNAWLLISNRPEQLAKERQTTLLYMPNVRVSYIPPFFESKLF